MFLRFVNHRFYDVDGAGGGAPASAPAGGAPQGAAPTETTTPTTTIDYERLGDIISRRSAGDTDKQLKSIIKTQYGLNGEELEIAVKGYKKKLEAERRAETERITQMEQENATLKAQIRDASIDQTITTLAQNEGVAAEKLSFILRLIERKDLTGDDGKVIEDKAKAALKAVLDAFPDFKGSGAAAGTRPLVGGSGGNSNTSVYDAQINAAFGVKN